MIGICEGAPDPKCAGAILSVFEYWTRVRLAHRSQAEIENVLGRGRIVHPPAQYRDVNAMPAREAARWLEETVGVNPLPISLL